MTYVTYRMTLRSIYALQTDMVLRMRIVVTTHAQQWRPKKEVLVALGERKCPVTFQSSCDPSKEKELLVIAIRNVFSDIFKKNTWCF